jgi:hypothetical protein
MRLISQASWGSLTLGKNDRNHESQQHGEADNGDGVQHGKSLSPDDLVRHRSNNLSRS